MDLKDMTVRELMEALNNGTVTRQDLAVIPGILGQTGRTSVTLSQKHLLWPMREEFVMVLAKALNDPQSGRPPELAKTARVIGCDPKTLIKHLQRHLGIKSWRELVARLLQQGIVAISKLQGPSQTEDL